MAALPDPRPPRASALTTALILGLAAGTVCCASLPPEAVAREAQQIVQVLGLEPGMSAADVGAGDGRFAEYLARRVGPEGRIFATEVDPKDLEELRGRVAEAGLENMEVVVGSQQETGLPEACCDAVLLRRVYHHLKDPVAIRAGLLRALRPGGLIAVIDFVPNHWQPPAGVPERGGHGVTSEEVIRDMTASGFELVRRVEDWRGEGDDYCLVFRRPRPRLASPPWP